MKNNIHPASMAVVLTNTKTGAQTKHASINKAASYIGAAQTTLSRALKNGYKVYGYSIAKV